MNLDLLALTDMTLTHVIAQSIEDDRAAVFAFAFNMGYLDMEMGA